MGKDEGAGEKLSRSSLRSLPPVWLRAIQYRIINVAACLRTRPGSPVSDRWAAPTVPWLKS